MTPPDKHDFDDAQLLHYLLGALPSEEAERLDELSITNDDFSWRLRAAENELVDSYIRSELSGETLKRFQTNYLSSAKRREKVAFAEGLFRFQASAAKTATQPVDVGSFFSRLFTHRRMVFQFAGAAFVMLLIAGYLLFDNMRLRQEIQSATAAQKLLEQMNRETKSQPKQPAAEADAQKTYSLVPGENRDLNKLNTLALLLPPPSRGISSIKTLTVPSQTDLVVLLLTLESTNYPRYVVTLKDPATSTAVWRSSDLEATAEGSRPGVAVSFRANLLKSQNYIAELSGVSQNGEVQAVGDYAFRVAVK